ncbi:hypothetical protein BDN72DRAFT_269953 [Pluteus cervinus]|uniref:Uncharacterized protein n=1 Tax=Pluteus cervinus TaxID=181527 RepID=A0ACD3B5H4_9AGAR|nr:hypothetical protein BDN72DRAFT_269953 [Pluteus cervinus]
MSTAHMLPSIWILGNSWILGRNGTAASATRTRRLASLCWHELNGDGAASDGVVIVHHSHSRFRQPSARLLIKCKETGSMAEDSELDGPRTVTLLNCMESRASARQMAPEGFKHPEPVQFVLVNVNIHASSFKIKHTKTVQLSYKGIWP